MWNSAVKPLLLILFILQSYLILVYLKEKQLGSGSSLTNLDGHLKVETENRDHYQITADVVGMSQGSR